MVAQAITIIVAFVVGIVVGMACIVFSIGFGIKAAFEAAHNVTGLKNKDLSKAENDLLDEIDSEHSTERIADNVS